MLGQKRFTAATLLIVICSSLFGAVITPTNVRAETQLGDMHTYGAPGGGSPNSGACTTTVQSGGSIQNALNTATSGDTVCVGAGNYEETVTISTDGITLRAIAAATIEGAILTGNNQTIDGFIIEDDTAALSSGDRAGVALTDTTGAQVLNNTIRSHALTIGVQCTNRNGTCDNGLIANNTIYDLEGYGIWINNSSNTVEFNDIHSLYRTHARYDVDGIRFFGDGHIIRNNYIHDIDHDDSVMIGSDTPHVDCFQTYTEFQSYSPDTNPIHNNNILIENNYCINVSRQCLIAENNATTDRVTYDITFRGNVCDMTEDNQAINIKGADNVILENNLIINRHNQYHVVYLSAGGGGGRSPATNTTISNNILVRFDGSMNFVSLSSSSGELVQNNHEITGVPSGLDTSRPDLYADVFLDSNTIDMSVTSIGGLPTQDVRGFSRAFNSTADIGPFEWNDTVAPVITLSQPVSGTLNLEVGDSFELSNDIGFSANDNFDGDVTSSVVVAGDTVPVDASNLTTTSGTYTKTLNVSDATGNTATEVQVKIIVANGPDTDNISDDTEDNAPNSGDYNDDGTADSQQAHVASIPNTVVTSSGDTSDSNTDAYTGLIVPSSSTIQSFSAMAEESLSRDDADYNYPIGLFDFSFTVTPGATESITLQLDQLYDTTNWEWRKYDGTNYSSVPNVTFGTASVGSETVTTVSYNLTDGGALDLDGLANGTIVDPAGPARIESLSDTGSPAQLIIVTGATLLVATISLQLSSKTSTYRSPKFYSYNLKK